MIKKEVPSDLIKNNFEQMNKNNHAIIMAGGVGSRFWPWSKKSMPKQFLDVLNTGKTLIQQTYERINRICPEENILIITNQLYSDTIAKQLPELPEENILSEPKGKNTAPCIAYGAFKIQKKDADARIIVAPSDHVILKEDLFSEVVQEGFSYASENDVLITIGIKPHKPETGYGYIHSSGDILKEKEGQWQFSTVKTFTEKPDLATARIFFENGDYYWNAGIFIWSVDSIISALQNHLPGLYKQFDQFDDSFNRDEEPEAIRNIYNVCDNISIDYGVMEKAKNVKVISTDIGWSDLGSWSSIQELSDQDEAGNTTFSANHLFYDSENCILKTRDGKVAVIEGLKDYIIVDEENALMICRKENEQRIKQFVKDVGEKFGEEFV